MTHSEVACPDTAATVDALASSSQPLIVAITARALFDLEDSHGLFERDGIQAYSEHQRARENDVLSPGIAFALVRKLLALNDRAPSHAPHVEVILLSRNSSDSGLGIFNSIQHHGLAISRATFTAGAPTWPYIRPFGAQLFLSANPESVRNALHNGVAAATILPAHPPPAGSAQDVPVSTQAGTGVASGQIRIAFDGDAVIFGDESERVSQEQGLAAFQAHETSRSGEPLSGGPFKGFLAALHDLQCVLPSGQDSPIRTALVTARSAPAHKRVILTLREWGVRLDEALFLGGRAKGPFLETFGADIFFDDSEHNIDSARQHVAAGHVPHGVAND